MDEMLDFLKSLKSEYSILWFFCLSLLLAIGIGNVILILGMGTTVACERRKGVKNAG